jgi:hypothetical protein
MHTYLSQGSPNSTLGRNRRVLFLLLRVQYVQYKYSTISMYCIVVHELNRNPFSVHTRTAPDPANQSTVAYYSTCTVLVRVCQWRSAPITNHKTSATETQPTWIAPYVPSAHNFQIRQTSKLDTALQITATLHRPSIEMILKTSRTLISRVAARPSSMLMARRSFSNCEPVERIRCVFEEYRKQQ